MGIPSKSISANSSDSHLETFLAWSIFNHTTGIEPGSKISLSYFNEYNRGFLSNSDIAKGETVLSLPLNICLIAEDPNIPPPYEGADWSVCLACRILKEMSRGFMSPWIAYLKSFPPLKEDHFDIIKRNTSTLEYPLIMKSIDRIQKNIIKSYLDCPLSCHGGANLRYFSWALSMVKSRSFTIKGYHEKDLHLLIPVADLFNHGGADVQPFRKSTEKTLSSNISLQIIRNKIKTEWQLIFTAHKKITHGEEVLIDYGRKTNDEYILNYGFVPIFNPWDETVLFGNIKKAGYWWITCFGKDLTPALRNSALQSIISTELYVQYQDHVSSRDISSTMRKKEIISTDKEIKIYYGGDIDANIKVAFARAWMSVEPNIQGLNAARLAEISIALRAAQALTSFSTSLLDDLFSLVEMTRGMNTHIFDIEVNYYDRKYNYYKTKMHKMNNSHCSINDLIKLAFLIFTQKYFSSLYFNHNKNSILIEFKISISFRLSKKMILIDLILII